MAGKRKVTDEEIQIARQVIAARRDALRKAALYPTLAQMAEKMRITPRYLQQLIAGKAR